TPSNSEMGVCTSQLKTMTWTLSQTARSVVGSVSTSPQLSNPAQVMAEIPSQCTKLSTTTPTRGTNAKTPKKANAGTAMIGWGPVRPVAAPVSESGTDAFASRAAVTVITSVRWWSPW